MVFKKVYSVRLINFTEIYCLTNEKKYDVDNLTQRHLLFVAGSYNASSVAPLSDYMHNPVNQELISKDDYFDVLSDERLYLNLRARFGSVKEVGKLERIDSRISLHILLKEAATRKLRSRVWSYSLGDYLYILCKNGLTLRHRTYTINRTDDDLLE